MKLKMVIVDLEIPPRVKKWGLRIGIPALVLSVAAVAFAAPLHTWSTGDTLQASDLNGNFDNLQGQITTLQTEVAALQDAGKPVSAVVAITATVTGTNGGTATATCPAGYTLIGAGIADDLRSQSGTNGWTNGGIIQCEISGGNQLTTSLNDYQNGSSYTSVTCWGVCVLH
jgi:hypothetical protein